MMKRLLAIAALLVGAMISTGQATAADRAGCTEDEVRSGTMCIHFDGEGARYMDR